MQPLSEKPKVARIAFINLRQTLFPLDFSSCEWTEQPASGDPGDGLPRHRRRLQLLLQPAGRRPLRDQVVQRHLRDIQASQ